MLQAGHRFRLDLEKCTAFIARRVGPVRIILRATRRLALSWAPVDDAHAAVAEDAENLIAGHVRVFAGSRRASAGRNGPRVARQLRRGGVERSGIGKVIGEARLSTGHLEASGA